MITVKTWLYCKFYNGMKDRINPAFQWQRGVWVFERCVCVCLWAFMCLNVFQEREWRKEREANGRGQAEPRSPPLPPPHRRTAWADPPTPTTTTRTPRPSTSGLCRLLRPFSSPGPALSRKPLYHSLLILPKHVVLFALHVLKVKVAPSHTFVDVFDVVAGGLKVSGGVVGPRGEDLWKINNTYVATGVLSAIISMMKTSSYCHDNPRASKLHGWSCCPVIVETSQGH